MTTFDDVRGHAIVCGLQKTLDYLMEGATPLELFALGEVLAHQAAQKARREHRQDETALGQTSEGFWPQKLEQRRHQARQQGLASTLAAYRQES